MAPEGLLVNTLGIRPPSAPRQTEMAADPLRPLFGLGTIALASLLGSVLAGVWLVSMNYVALGQRGLAWLLRLLALPLLALAAISAIGYVVNSQGVARVTVVLSYLVLLPAAVYLMADWAQGAAIRAHAAAGVPARSWRWALLVALAFLMLATVLPLIVMLMFTVVGLAESI